MFNFKLAEKTINKHTEEMEELRKSDEEREYAEHLARLEAYKKLVEKRVLKFIDTANEVIKKLNNKEIPSNEVSGFYPVLSKDSVTFRFYSDVDVELDDMGRTSDRALKFNGLKDFIENKSIQAIADILIERTPDFPTNRIDDYQATVSEVLGKYNIRIRGFIYHKEYEETLDCNWRSLPSDFHMCTLFIEFMKEPKKKMNYTPLDLVQGLNTICFKNFDDFLHHQRGLDVSRKVVQTRTTYFVNNKVIATAER